jgi:N-carbamoyl-L-amino-acid hydrolase
VVATVGRLELTPNVANAVPGRVELILEVRSDAAEVLDRFVDDLVASIRPQLSTLRVEIAVKPLSSSRPTACSPEVMDAVTAAAEGLDLASRRLSSGAGHDAAYLATCCPVGMVFIPCREGRSHCAEESIEPEQLMDGARVLCATLLELDRRRSH